MASTRISQEFTNGETFTIELTIDDTYPDALDETRAQALRLWQAALTEDAETEGG